MELYACVPYTPLCYGAWKPMDSLFRTQHSTSSSDDGDKYPCIQDLIYGQTWIVSYMLQLF